MLSIEEFVLDAKRKSPYNWRAGNVPWFSIQNTTAPPHVGPRRTPT